MAREMSIAELSEYYIKRYAIRQDNETPGYNAALRTRFEAQIRRITQNTSYKGNKSFYDHMKFGEKLRKADLEEFERFCLIPLIKYIQKKYLKYDEGKIQEDLNEYNELNYWDERATLRAIANDKAYTGEPLSAEEEETLKDEFTSISEKAKNEMINMMVMAIYDIFYDGFNYEKLEKDMALKEERAELFGEYGTTPTGKEEKAIHDLKNYRNYIGKSKR